jgi:Probable cobalt transporter subunit (CbtB)
MSEVALDRHAAAGSAVAPAPVASPRELLPYALFGGLVLMFIIYFVGAEEGALSLIGGNGVHELVHDARHLLGFPCH